MNNFQLHQLAQEMSDSRSAYELAREVLRLREALKEAEATIEASSQPKEDPLSIG